MSNLNGFTVFDKGGGMQSTGVLRHHMPTEHPAIAIYFNRKNGIPSEIHLNDVALKILGNPKAVIYRIKDTAFAIVASSIEDPRSYKVRRESKTQGSTFKVSAQAMLKKMGVSPKPEAIFEIIRTTPCKGVKAMIVDLSGSRTTIPRPKRS